MTTLQELQDRGMKPRHVGNKIILIIKPINDDTYRIYGFDILSYTPQHEAHDIQHRANYTTTTAPTWDGAYDRLFGDPTRRPVTEWGAAMLA